MQKSDPPRFSHYNLYMPILDTLTQTLILDMISQHTQVYLCLTNIAFLDPNSALICASRKRSDACVTAHGISDKQFVYADRAVFSTSKVC